jgi:hypothetical protein
MHIDYWCTYGRFLMSPRAVAISNQNYVSSSKTRVSAGIKRQKLYISEWNSCQESIGGICIANTWRLAFLQPLTFSNQRPNAASSNPSPGLTVRFFGVNIRVFWKRESRPIKWHQYRLLICEPIFRLHICSLCVCTANTGLHINHELSSSSSIIKHQLSSFH